MANETIKFKVETKADVEEGGIFQTTYMAMNDSPWQIFSRKVYQMQEEGLKQKLKAFGYEHVSEREGVSFEQMARALAKHYISNINSGNKAGADWDEKDEAALRLALSSFINSEAMRGIKNGK